MEVGEEGEYINTYRFGPSSPRPFKLNSSGDLNPGHALKGERLLLAGNRLISALTDAVEKDFNTFATGTRSVSRFYLSIFQEHLMHRVSLMRS